MMKILMWPHTKTSTYIVRLTQQGWDSLQELFRLKETFYDAICDVCKVVPGCSLSVKKASLADVNSQVMEEYEDVLDCAATKVVAGRVDFTCR